MPEGWGWAGSISKFLEAPQEDVLRSLADHHGRALGMPPSQEQESVWAQEHEALTNALRVLSAEKPEARDWSVVFEYELPLEGGRRPDVVVLAGGTIVVFEFKSAPRYYQAHLDQVEAYARDLSEYHEASRGRTVVPVLVLRDVPAVAGRRDETLITDPDGMDRILLEHASDGHIDLDGWLSSAYAPLPTLVAAARRIFRHERVPHVWRAESAGIPQTVDLIAQLANEAEQQGTRKLVFVTGVPGSGKTLVGLRAVYERSETEGRSTFLSGNGPLVQVLQDALQSRVFVRDLHAFIKTYGIQGREPSQRVIVFDEAQRAWDRDYMERKRQVPRSEPDLLIEAGERVPDWCLLVGLVGEGQEIHSGEEAGLAQWREAAEQANDSWTIYCSPRVASAFDGLPVEVREELDLTVSLRTRRAEELHQWVSLVLQGSASLAARQAMRIQAAQAYPMYLTRDLEEAKEYVRTRYEGEEDRRYGLLASSHAKNVDRHGVSRHFLDMRRLKVAKWFNAPLDDPMSGCSFELPVTEFQCQGLEIDMPIVCWGTDYRWDGEVWRLKPIRRQYPQDNPEQLLQNAYRVLLTRGRDGLVIWIPPDKELDQTEHVLLAAGVRPLPEADAVSAGEPIIGSAGVGS